MALGPAAAQRSSPGVGEASEAASTATAVPQDLPENARSHRRAEAHGRRGRLSNRSSEKRSPYSLPRSALHETFSGNSSSTATPLYYFCALFREPTKRNRA